MGTRSEHPCLMPCASGKPDSPRRETGRRGWWAPRTGSKGLQGCQGCEHRSNCFLPVSRRINFHRSSCSFGKLLATISDTRGKATLWPSWKEKSPDEMAWAQPQPGEMNEELTVKPIDGPQHRAEGRKSRGAAAHSSISEWALDHPILMDTQQELDDWRLRLHHTFWRFLDLWGRRNLGAEPKRMCCGQENVGEEARPLRSSTQLSPMAGPWVPSLFLASPPGTSFLRQTSDILWDQFLINTAIKWILQ